VEIEVEGLTLRYGTAIQVVGPEHERTWPIGQATRTRRGRWSKHQSILAGLPPFANARVRTIRHAGEFMEYGSERTAQLIAGGATGKGNGSARHEGKAQRIEPETQVIILQPGDHFAAMMEAT